MLWIIGFDPYSDDHYFDFETRQKNTVNVDCNGESVISINTLFLKNFQNKIHNYGKKTNVKS